MCNNIVQQSTIVRTVLRELLYSTTTIRSRAYQTNSPGFVTTNIHLGIPFSQPYRTHAHLTTTLRTNQHRRRSHRSIISTVYGWNLALTTPRYCHVNFLSLVLYTGVFELTRFLCLYFVHWILDAVCMHRLLFICFCLFVLSLLVWYSWHWCH